LEIVTTSPVVAAFATIATLPVPLGIRFILPLLPVVSDNIPD
jgi:hypothetical protein